MTGPERELAPPAALSSAALLGRGASEGFPVLGTEMDALFDAAKQLSPVSSLRKTVSYLLTWGLELVA